MKTLAGTGNLRPEGRLADITPPTRKRITLQTEVPLLGWVRPFVKKTARAVFEPIELAVTIMGSLMFIALMALMSLAPLILALLVAAACLALLGVI